MGSGTRNHSPAENGAAWCLQGFLKTVVVGGQNFPAGFGSLSIHGELEQGGFKLGNQGHKNRLDCTKKIDLGLL